MAREYDSAVDLDAHEQVEPDYCGVCGFRLTSPHECPICCDAFCTDHKEPRDHECNG
jgi:predicted nucleic acid binding AN1-type Zn finger protein